MAKRTERETEADKYHALSDAAKAEDLPLLRKYLNRGFDPNLADPWGTGMVLHWAAHHNKLEIVLELLNHGADPNARDKHGVTPLHHATRQGSPRIMSELLDRGGDPNARESHGFTVLHCAALCGRTDLYDLLLDGGTNLQAVDNVGRTALHWAASCSPDAVQPLLARGLDANVSDLRGDRPIHYAAFGQGNPEITRALLAAGADLHAVDSFGRTAPRIAEINKNSTLANLLRAASGSRPPASPNCWAATVGDEKRKPPRSPGR